MRVTLAVVSALVSLVHALPMHANSPHQVQEQALKNVDFHTSAPATDSVPVTANSPKGQRSEDSAHSLEAGAALPSKRKKIGRPLSATAKRLEPGQKTSQRRQKAQELGLERNSPMPLYSHKLAPHEIKAHPLTASWNTHRQAMENGILEQNQLPPLFKTFRGEYKFAPKFKKGLPSVERDSIQERKRINWKNSRSAKVDLLKLARQSALPKFAYGLSTEDIRKHRDIDNWHHHRKMVEGGLLKPENLPAHFQSSGDLVFREQKARGPPRKYTHMSDEEKVNLQLQHRTKIKELKLGKSSALPVFAYPLATAEDIRGHDEIHNWHHHRSLVEEGSLKAEDLPEQMKAQRGSLRFRRRRSPSSKAADAVPKADITKAKRKTTDSRSTSNTTSDDKDESKSAGEVANHPSPDSDVPWGSLMDLW